MKLEVRKHPYDYVSITSELGEFILTPAEARNLADKLDYAAKEAADNKFKERR